MYEVDKWRRTNIRE